MAAFEYGNSVLFIVVTLAVLIAVPTAIGYAILRPVTQAVRNTRQPTQFHLTDFAWLILQLQIVLGAVVGYVPRGDTESFVIFLGFGAIAAITMWWGAVQTMLKAGVRGALRRGVFVMVLLPTSLLLMMGGAILLIAASTWLFVEFGRAIRIDAQLLLALLGFALALGSIALMCWLLRLVSRWVIADTSPLRSLKQHGATTA